MFSVCSYLLLIALCELNGSGDLKTCISQGQEWRHWKSSFQPWQHHHRPPPEDATSDTMMSQLILYAHGAVVSTEGLIISMHHCYKQVSCSGVWGWQSRLSSRVELCADMPFRINQAYQSDRCLSTCYKHLPRLAPAPSPCRLFTRIQPPYSGPVYSLAVALISGQRSAADLLY